MNPFEQHKPIDIEISKFYPLIDLIRSVKSPQIKQIEELHTVVAQHADTIDEEVLALAKANNSLLREAKKATAKKTNPFASVEEHEDIFADLRHTVDGDNFMRVIFDVMQAIQLAAHAMRDSALALRPGTIVLSKNSSKAFDPDDMFEPAKLQAMMIECQMNAEVVGNFVRGVFTADSASGAIVALGDVVVRKIEGYYDALRHRHSVEGIRIHRDPITTDLAISIFENVDAHGEIADGRKADEISAYSIRKASVIANSIKTGLVGSFIRDPTKLLDFVKGQLSTLWSAARMLESFAKPLADKGRSILGPKVGKRRSMSDYDFGNALVALDDLDPRDIVFKEKTGLLTAEERFGLEFQNETLARVAEMLSNTTSTDDLIEYILQRKQALRDYYQDENSFYVCKIGAGNQFRGEAPGELVVVPGTRPSVNLDEIVGSGFAEVKSFIDNVEASSQWQDIFVAMSPSRTADKANALLIGPPGCGKSEILRAVGGDKKSVGVFATGSDFLTCWKGEAEKNPKRLFEAALRISKETKKHVHILIDEIDTILSTETGRDSFGGTNLVTEFQNLMDGVVNYPNLSVWGATNFPERIPMACLRRFSKVWIVGELTQQDRVTLLRSFTGFMPIDASFVDETWEALATRLEGATGDVLRKIVDYVWRDKVGWLVNNHKKEAAKLVDFLNEGERFDVRNFDVKQRSKFLNLVRPMMSVKPADLEKSVELHLENISVNYEIMTAKTTYAEAKKFVAGMKGR